MLILPSRAYAARVASGAIEADPAQQKLLGRLDALVEALRGYGEKKRGALAWLLHRETAPPRGLYIHGEVGRGKTMLMDLFFEAAPLQRKNRRHFHEFMAEVHERIFAWRQAAKAGEVSGTDPIQPVADQIAKESLLLCFDEFHVTDIADAMILGRLFTRLFAQGVVLVATSNVAPGDLYRDGLNRALFLPFIALLDKTVDVVRLDARTDFRLEKLSGRPVYHVPADAVARAALDDAWASLTGGAPPRPRSLAVKGRELVIPAAFDGTGRAGFAELCDRPLGPSDFLAIAHAFHTLIVDDIPILQAEQRNTTKRFITLIDTLYDNNVKLLASAAAPPAELYRGAEGNEAFAFQRTVSRLIEMAGTEYLARPHGNADSRASGNTSGLVET